MTRLKLDLAAKFYFLLTDFLHLKLKVFQKHRLTLNHLTEFFKLAGMKIFTPAHFIQKCLDLSLLFISQRKLIERHDLFETF